MIEMTVNPNRPNAFIFITEFAAVTEIDEIDSLIVTL